MITIWHNPRCAKSRATLALIEAAGHTPEVRKYLEDAPTVAELQVAQAALGDIPLIQMVRTGEKRFKELGLTRDTAPDALLQAMADTPILIERPMVFAQGKAVIGRPPENVSSLL